jgi:DNA primase
MNKAAYAEMLGYKDVYDKLSPGESTHIHHCVEGPQNDRLYIKRSEDGNVILFHCKHCSFSGGVRQSNSSYSKVKEKMRHSGALSSRNVKKPTLPFDSVGRITEWPSRAKVWVYRGQLSDKEIEDYGFVYSPYYDRVFYPVYNNNVISCTIGRKLKDDDTPKYLIYKDKDFNNLWYSNPTSSNKVCIVEDVLSAIRCSRFVAGAALLGTNFTDGAIKYLTDRHNEFIIYLDDDKPQVKMKQLQLQRMLELFGDVKLITKTGKDPKELNDKQLEELLL